MLIYEQANIELTGACPQRHHGVMPIFAKKSRQQRVLSAQQRKAAAVLAEQGSMTDAAALVGVASETLVQWTRLPEFKRQLAREHTKATAKTVAELQAELSKPIVTVRPAVARRHVGRPHGIDAAPAEMATELAVEGKAPTVGLRRNTAVSPSSEMIPSVELPAVLVSERPSLPQAIHLLQLASEKTDVGRVAVRFARRFWLRVVLLVHRRGRLIGWLGEGPNLDLDCISQIRISLTEASTLVDVWNEGVVFTGPLKTAAMDRTFLVALKVSSPPVSSMVFPVRAHDRPVCLIYCDNGDQPRVADLGNMYRLAEEVAVTFERLLLQRKQLKM
jgi:hypothetical protein